MQITPVFIVIAVTQIILNCLNNCIVLQNYQNFFYYCSHTFFTQMLWFSAVSSFWQFWKNVLFAALCCNNQLNKYSGERFLHLLKFSIYSVNCKQQLFYFMHEISRVKHLFLIFFFVTRYDRLIFSFFRCLMFFFSFVLYRIRFH